MLHIRGSKSSVVCGSTIVSSSVGVSKLKNRSKLSFYKIENNVRKNENNLILMIIKIENRIEKNDNII